RGDGAGGFKSVPGQESGLTIYGEQRGAAVADFDHDGRTDLVVTENGAETKLYRNVAAKPGLRIRLLGRAGNTDAIGAVIRWKVGQRFGPARELHAGSGYWSQDAAVQVLNVPAEASLQVRWPGGATTTNNVPPGAREIGVESTGKLTIVR
ncbi:MAG TPA: VCBS repeat-containing protein, partial [Sphingomicrobium sp.]